jgi:hypothetical protein
MGGSKSKVAVESLSEQITNIAMNTVQNCIVNVDQTQNTVVNNTGWQLGGTTRVKQTTSVDSKCFMDSNKQLNLQNQIYSAVKQAAEANGVGVLSAIGASQSVSDAKLISLIRNNVTMQNIQNNYTNIINRQTTTVNSSGVQLFHDTDVTQGAVVFANSVLQSVEKAGVFNALSTSIDQQAKATTINPLAFIGDIVGSVAGAISSSFIAIAAIVICVLGAITYMILGGASAAVSSEETPEETTDETTNETPAEETNKETTAEATAAPAKS